MNLEPDPIAHKNRRLLWWALGGGGVLVVVIVASLFSSQLGAQVWTPGFTSTRVAITGPDRVVIGQKITVKWTNNATSQNYVPAWKIELLSNATGRWVTLASRVPNNGQATVDVPNNLKLLKPGNGTLRLIARNSKGELIMSANRTRAVRIVRIASRPTPTSETDDGSGSVVQCPLGSPEIAFAANSETNNTARYTHTGAPGTYRIEIISPESLTDDDYANYTWANDPNYQQNRIHGGHFFVTKNADPQFGTDGRVANVVLGIGGMLKDPPYNNSRTVVANESRGTDGLVSLANGDVLSFVMNGIRGQYGNYNGSIHVRICPEST